MITITIDPNASSDHAMEILPLLVHDAQESQFRANTRLPSAAAAEAVRAISAQYPGAVIRIEVPNGTIAAG